MDTIFRELRHALRTLHRSPGFTIAAVLTLALGIGATTAIFSVVDAVLLEPLPFRDPGRLVVLREQERGTGREPEPTSAETLEDWRAESRSFEALAGWIYWGLALTGSGEPVEIATVRASPELFPLLGVEPALGRSFTAEEAQAGRDRVVVLSHGLWLQRFGGDRSAIGRTITLDGEPHEVVGVMPPGFRFPDEADVGIWMPLAYKPYELRTRNQRMFDVIGRLRPEVGLEQARLEMSAIARRLGEEYPATNADYDVVIRPARDEAVGMARDPLLILLGAVGLVLLMACANVASLFLARTADRTREIAVRAALGAGRARLIRYLLAESVVVALLGAAGGLLIAAWAVDAIVALDPGHLPGWNAIEIDRGVLAFTAAVALLTALLSGLAPALTGTRLRLAAVLKEGAARATSARGTVRLRQALIVGEVALSVVLLLGAGLLIRSFWRLLDEDPGFRTENLLAATLYLPDNQYPENADQLRFFDDLLARLRTLPGVAAAGGVTTLPLSPVGIDHDMPFVVDGTPSAQLEPRPQADFRIATPDYFQAMRIPLLAGRAFTEHDREDGRHVVVVNRTLAERYVPGGDPIGRTVRWGGGAGTPAEIVGVVADVRHRGLDAEPRPEFYIPHRQLSYGSLTIVLRATGDPRTLADAVKREIFAIDPALPVSELATMDQLVSRSVAERRFNLILLGGFAVLALLLAAIGIYGVIAYSVALRTREIGVRIALGAHTGDVVGGILRGGLTLAGAGAAIGTLAALYLTRFLAVLLYDVDPLDPPTFIAAPLILLAVALAAAGLPARRAARLDPMRALQHDG